MATEVLQQINAQDFIAQTSIQRRLDTHLVPINQEVGIPQPAEQLTQRFLKSFTPDGISTFVNGEQPKSPRDSKTRREFDDAIRMVVVDQTQDLFDENGNVLEGKEQEWENVQQISPELVKILTSRDNYVLSIYRSHATAPIAYAIEAARNPRVIEETVFNVGFGGSDDAYTSTRLPAYGEPAARLTHGIHTLYEQRENQAITKAQLEKEYALYEVRLGRELIREERKEISQQVRNGNAVSEPLTEEEKAGIRVAKGIPGRMPTIRYFFADHAAMTINHTKNRAAISERTVANMRALYDHIVTKYPHLADQIEIVRDAPWDSHPLHAQLQIDYLAQVVEEGESTHPSIRSAVEHLRSRGRNHGGENGHREAHRYAGYHDEIFQDLTDLPFTKYLYRMDPDSGFTQCGQPINANPLFNIVIGGRAEKEFDAVRNYVSENASMEGYIAYVSNRLQQENDPNRQAELLGVLEKLQRLANITRAIASNRYDETTQPFDALRPDRPIQTISLITIIGKQAPYYATEVDLPLGSDVSQQIEMIHGKIEELTSMDIPSTEKTKRRVNLQAVIFDLEATLKDNAR